MKLSSKLYFTAAVVIFVIIILSGVSIKFVGGVPRLIADQHEFQSLESNVLHLKRVDENFRKGIRVSFDASSDLVNKHHDAIKDTKNSITATLVDIKERDISDTEEITYFEESFLKYTDGLEKNIEIMASMTSWKAKLVSEARNAEVVIKSLEQSVYSFVQNQNSFQLDPAKISVNYEKLLKVGALFNDFLQVRRAEKSFFIRSDLNYYKKNVKEVDHLIQDALSVAASFKGQVNIDAANQIIEIMKKYKSFMAGYVNDFKKYNEVKSNILNVESEMLRRVKTISKFADEAISITINQFYSFFAFFCAAILAGILFSTVLLVRSITAPIIASSQSLRTLANKLNGSSQEVQGASENLASSAAEQAASIQETSSSIEELDGMVKNNLTDADKTSVLTTSVLGKVEEGITAVNDLREGSEAMVKSNARIQELVDVISAIGEKTKIIDEIVFQTKLLSFNASVEAERAGEHGRGFAVVAQEVGNLAQMSGNAALEISSIVGNSISQAKNITDENGIRVKSSGVMVDRIALIFTEVEKDSKDVANSASGIRSASREQSTGIEQINTAVVEIDKSVQAISSSAEETSSASKELANMSEQMNVMVDQLASIVFGKGGARNIVSSSSAASRTDISVSRRIDPVITPVKPIAATKTVKASPELTSSKSYDSSNPFAETGKTTRPSVEESDTNWDTL